MFLAATPLTKTYRGQINLTAQFSFSAGNGSKIRLLNIMKKKILLILVLFTGTVAMAQQKTGFGIRAGILSSEMKGEAVNNLKNLLDFTDGMVTTRGRTGFFAGVNADIPMGKNLSIEPGLYYSQKGYELAGELNVKGLEFLGANAKAQLQSQYLDIPLLLKFNSGGLQLFAGPQLSYLMKSDLRTTAGVLGINLLNKTLDATSQFNRWDAALSAGIGYKFSNGISISGAYDYGLMKVDKNSTIDSYTRGLKLGLGINF